MINLNKKKKGFTLIELIFVIIVIGLLASVGLSTVNRSIRTDAVNSIVSALRYTQHLALSDNKMDPKNDLWIRSLWSIQFLKCGDDFAYKIGSDTGFNGIINENEIAMSPIDRKLLFVNQANCLSNKYSDDTRIGRNFEIDSIITSNCGDQKTISFDYLGRPHNNVKDSTFPNYDTLNQNDCIITFGFKDSLGLEDIQVTVHKETGFITVLNREGI